MPAGPARPGGAFLQKIRHNGRLKPDASRGVRGQARLFPWYDGDAAQAVPGEIPVEGMFLIWARERKKPCGTPESREQSSVWD